MGVGEGLNVVGSDGMGMIEVRKEYVEVMEKEMVIVSKDEVRMKNVEGEVV
ncbi:hypothetical protein [Cytobacillus oceanisediminis]|uniref:hypothetical protein n=1 Tax=Cytobacillus oceanisediminis TaxID=665099 RepID=UPI001642540E|nr:hypothetical protein [Cytobacillus oceanisediminis]